MSVTYNRPYNGKSKFVERIALEALSTHLSADYHHIGLMADVISRISFSDSQLANFVLFTDLATSTGLFALSYNHDIDLAISQNNTSKLISLIESDPNNFFVELYDNMELTADEKKVIEELKNVEYNSILELLNTYHRTELEETVDLYPGPFLNLCPRNEEDFLCQMYGDNIQVCTRKEKTYDSCYKQICLEQKKENYISSKLPTVISTPSSKVIEYGTEKHYEILCLPFIEFIKRLTISPSDFADHLISKLRQLFTKEIKMYSRFLKQKENGYYF